MNFRDLIDKNKMTKFQWSVVFLATLMNFLDGYDVLALAFTASNIKAKLNLSSVQLGYLFSFALIGMAIGSIFLAPFADKFGRRKVLMTLLTLSGFCMLFCAFTNKYYLLLMLRFLTGLGVGGVLVIATSLVSEFSNRRFRAFAIGIYTSGFSLGASFSGLTSNVLQQYFSWHSVFFLGGILAQCGIILFYFFLPESVDFLVEKRKNSKILSSIALKLNLPNSSLFPTKKDVRYSTDDARLAITKILDKNHIKTTLILWLSFFIAMFSFYIITPWTPILLKEAGLSGTLSVSIGYLITLGGVFGALTYGLISSKFDMRLVMIASLLSTSLSIVAFVFTHYLPLLMFFGVSIGFWINGVISGLYTFAPHFYHSDIRNSGVGFTVGIGRIGGILAPIIAGYGLEFGFDRQDLYLFLVILLLLSAIITKFLPK